MSVSETRSACRPIDACQLSLSATDYRGNSYSVQPAWHLISGVGYPSIYTLHGEYQGIVQFGDQRWSRGFWQLQENAFDGSLEAKAEDHSDTKRPRVIKLSSNALFPKI